MTGYVKVATLDELPEGKSRTVWVNGRSVALFNVDGEIFATSDACPHEGVSLGTGGELDGDVVTCGYHYWAFNVRTGESADGMEERVACYAVKVVGTDIFIKSPSPVTCGGFEE